MAQRAPEMTAIPSTPPDMKALAHVLLCKIMSYVSKGDGVIALEADDILASALTAAVEAERERIIALCELKLEQLLHYIEEHCSDDEPLKTNARIAADARATQLQQTIAAIRSQP